MSPSENNKRIAKNTGMLYIRMLLSMLVSLYTSRLVLEILGVNDYGVLNVVGSLVAMFSFLNNTMNAAVTRFFAFDLGKKDNTQLKKTFRVSVTILFGIAIVLLVLLETVGLWFVNYKLVIPPDRIIAANWVYQFSVLGSLIYILVVPLSALIIAHEKMTIFAYLGLIEVFSKLLFVFLLYFSGYDKLITYGFLQFLSIIIVFILNHFFCKKLFDEYSMKLLYDKSQFKKMLSFTGWSFIGSFATVIKIQGNNIILNLFFGPTVNAARGISNQVNFAVSSFTQNFSKAINPQIIKTYAANEIQTMLNLMFQGAKFSYYLTFILALPLLMETKFILNLWLVEVPDYTIIFTQLIIINTLLESFSRTIVPVINATGDIKRFQIVIGSLLLFNLPISYILLKNGFSPEFTLYTSIFLSLAANLINVKLLKNLIPQFNILDFLKNIYVIPIIVSITAASIPIILQTQLDLGWFRFIMSSILSVLFSLLTIWFMGLNRQEKEFIRISCLKLYLNIKQRII